MLNLLSKKMKTLHIILLCLITHSLVGKVLIFSYAYNRPDFIALQYKTFKRFLKNEYEFVIFNDANEPQNYNSIRETCDKLAIPCIDIPQEIHERPYLGRPEISNFASYQQPSVRNSNVVQYSLDTLGFDHNDYLLLVDSDMFLIKEFDIKKFMCGYDAAGFIKHCCHDRGRMQHESNVPHRSYIWIGLVLIDMNSLHNKQLLNFNCGTYNNVSLDAGGYTSPLLNLHNLRIKPIDRTSLRELICNLCNIKRSHFCNHTTKQLDKAGYDKDLIAFIQNTPILHKIDKFRNTEFFLNNTFVHYRAGSNYHNVSHEIITIKTNAFNIFFEKLLQED